MTLQQQTSLFTETELTSLQEASLAKMQASRNKMAKVNKGFKVQEQDYSSSLFEQSKKQDHVLLLPKTSQTFLKLTVGRTLQEYSPNWPEWGTMRNGEFVEHRKSVRPITVPGCIWLLTPTASDCKREKLSFPMYQKRLHRSPGGLSEQLFRLVGAVPGILNPQFYAWMMGYPLNWLERQSTVTETQSYHK